MKEMMVNLASSNEGEEWRGEKHSSQRKESRCQLSHFKVRSGDGTVDSKLNFTHTLSIWEQECDFLKEFLVWKSTIYY